MLPQEAASKKNQENLGQLSGPRIEGAISWFSGGGTATGIPTSRGGIATPFKNTLGGWWLVKFPNGKVLVLQQIDSGPCSNIWEHEHHEPCSPKTNRLIDVASGSLAAAGYSSGNFPTGASAKAIYLGKNKPTGAGLEEFITPFGGGNIGKAFEEGFNAAPGPKLKTFKDIGELIEKSGEILQFLGSSEGWFRIGKVVIGSAILLIAISELAKVGSGSTGQNLPTKIVAVKL